MLFSRQGRTVLLAGLRKCHELAKERSLLTHTLFGNRSRNLAATSIDTGNHHWVNGSQGVERDSAFSGNETRATPLKVD